MEDAQPVGHGNIELAERGMAETKLDLTVEQVIENHVGSLGWSQLLHVFLVSVAWMFDAQNTLITIFSDAQPAAWRCKNNSTIPSASSLCNISSTSNDHTFVCGLVPGTWEWVGGHKSSVIAEWGLICDHKFLAAVPASLFFIGSLLGSVFSGYLADGFMGRKRTMLLSCLLSSITGLLTSLSPNIWIYALLRMANGFVKSGISTCCIVLATEVVGRKWRGQVGQYGFFLFTVGFLSLPVIAYPTRQNWRNLYRIISLIPFVYSFLVYPFISESPRWLLVRGRSKEALEVLKKLARLNGKELPQNLCLLNPSISEVGGDQSKGVAATDTNESLWRTKWAAKRMALVMIAGFGIGFVYYGVQLNVENLNFNLYFAVAANALMEIPAVLIGSVLLRFSDRRLLFSLSAFLAGISSILCIIFSGGKSAKTDEKKARGSWGQLTIESIGFMAASLAYDVLYVYCVELFPTNVRNFSLSMMLQTLMLGASIAPLLVVVGRFSPSLSFIIFGILSILSGLVSWWLPETRNAPLYETLTQQQEGEKQNCESIIQAQSAETN